ncbi:unnamed protein product [Sphagnum jensenii]|uniref:Uncharacterized protein n=1 Tax=Sphagnum jensenii TaxID=128206 RepID=A0ABP0W3M1_9BRYO
MYIDSYGLLQEGQDQMAFASYQNTASIYMKLRGMMDSFFKSDQTQCVVQLLSVYQEGRQDGMKHVVSTSCLCHSLP